MQIHVSPQLKSCDQGPGRAEVTSNENLERADGEHDQAQTPTFAIAREAREKNRGGSSDRTASQVAPTPTSNVAAGLVVGQQRPDRRRQRHELGEQHQRQKSRSATAQRVDRASAASSSRQAEPRKMESN